MNKLLAIAATAESITGLALLIWPPPVIRLLFGSEISGVGVVTSRIAGIALIALGLACWPDGAPNRGFSGMLTFSALVTLYLGYLGLAQEWTGMLLWPAIVLHASVTALLVRAWSEQRKKSAVEA